MAARTRVGLRLVVPSVLAGALLMGCSSDDDAPAPSGSPTPADTATPEPTSTDYATTSPEPDPTAQLEAEITAFFEEYIDAVNESWTSREALRQSRKMFVDTCSSCTSIYELAEDAHDRELRYEGELGTLDNVRLVGVNEEIVTFIATTSSAEAALVDEGGVVVNRFAAADGLQVAYQTAKDDSGNWVLIKDEVLS